MLKWLKCLVINTCDDIEFGHSVMGYLSHSVNYVVYSADYEEYRNRTDCDIVFFFPNYGDVCEIIDKTELNENNVKTFDIKTFVKDKISRSYSDIKFKPYICVIKNICNDSIGTDTERTVIISNNYSINGETIHPIFRSDYRNLSTEACIAIGVTNIIDSWYLESARDKQDTINRSIEFPPEYHQAGLGILNYFGTVIRYRYPDIPVMVRIEQEGLTVRMIIQTSEGHRETVEHTLQAYGLVIAGKMLPEELLSNPFHVLELKHKLDLVQTELRMKHDLLQIADSRYQDLQCQYQDQQRRLLSVETEMADMRQLIGDSLQTIRDAQQHAQELTSLLQPLLTNLTTQHDTAFQQAVVTLKGVIARGMTTQDEQTVKEALATLQQKEPGVLQQMVDLIGKNAITGSAGRLLYDWLMHLNVIFR